MAVEPIKVPSPGESVTEGRMAQWYKSDGAAVKVDEPLFELESDKAAQTVTAQVAGVLSISVPAGEVVAIGAVVGGIDPAGVATEKRSGAEGEKKAAVSASPSLPASDSPSAESRVSPAAGRVLAEKGVAASAVTGTGPKGLVTKEDAVGFHPAALKPPAGNGTAPAPAPAPAPVVTRAPGERETRTPMTMIRRRTAERLLESQNTTATLTTFNEADMSGVMDLRAKYNEKFEKKHGAKLGFMSVFVKAAVDALKAFPMVNSRIDGTDIVQQHFYDIGVAVSSEKGLFVPVLRDADKLGFADIEKKIGDLAKRARDGKIGIPDMMGGTFTLTNAGVFG